MLAASLHLLPVTAAVGGVGTDLDEGREPELGRRLIVVEGVGTLTQHIADRLGLGFLGGDESGVAALKVALGVVAQL